MKKYKIKVSELEIRVVNAEYHVLANDSDDAKYRFLNKYEENDIECYSDDTDDIIDITDDILTKLLDGRIKIIEIISEPEYMPTTGTQTN